MCIHMYSIKPCHISLSLCRFAISQSPPIVDGSQDISRLAVTLENGVTTISFVRPLNTTDRSGDIDLDRQFYMLWAIGGNVNNYQANDLNSIARHADRSASGLMTLCGGGTESCTSIYLSNGCIVIHFHSAQYQMHWKYVCVYACVY